MQTLTKRILEVAIILTILLTLFFRWYHHHRSEVLLGSALAGITQFNQMLWDRNGPGSQDAYLKIFNPEMFNPPGVEQSRPPWEDAFTMENLVREMNGDMGFFSVPEAPEWYRKRLETTRQLLDALEAAYAKGPYLAAPGEINFATKDFRFPSFLQMQISTKVLKQYALMEWLEGHHDESLRTMKDSLQLGDALRMDPFLISHLIRLALYDITLGGIDTLVWTNPSPEQNQKIFDLLQSMNPDQWQYPDYTENWVYSLAYIPEEFGAYSPETFAVTMMMMQQSQKEQNENLEKILQKAGILPSTPMDPGEIFSYVVKWTTLPAMRRRAVRVPPSFYESDPYFTRDQANHFNSIFYLMGRYRNSLWDAPQFRFQIRLQNEKDIAQVTLGSFWARVKHGELGRWPTLEEFHESSPAGEKAQWVATQDPRPLLSEFLRLNHNRPMGGDAPYFRIFENNPLNTLYYELPWPPLENLPPNFFTSQNYSQKFPSETIRREEMVEWVKYQLLAFRPLVESVTVATYITPNGQYLNDRLEFIPYPYNFRLPGYMDSEQTMREYGMGGYGMDVSTPAYDPVARARQMASGRSADATVESASPMQSVEAAGGGAVNVYTQMKIYPASLRIKLKFPKTTYWVIHPGPDDELDGFSLRYDPSNGLTSRGDIMKLAGWD